VRDYPAAARGTEAVETLICSVEELVARLPAAADSEMGRLRARATNALAEAKVAVAVDVARASKQTVPVVTAYLDDWARKWPRTALAAAAMLGLALGLSFSRSGRSRPRRPSR
jgi:ElaB/YqjD/DUF883 family membrane-anchored ribosome-binding protein